MLNSKTEYNRCHIARLKIEDESEYKKREEYIRKEEEQLAEELDREQQSWEQGRTRDRDKERRRTAMAVRSTDVRLRGEKTRREEPPGSSRKSKRRKFVLMEEDWGASSTNAPRSNVLSVELQSASNRMREPSRVVAREPVT